MSDERFDVVIGARDEASPVLDKFNQNLKTTKTTTSDVAAGFQNLGKQAQWAFLGMSGAIAGVAKVYGDFDELMAKVATQLPGETIEYLDEFTDAVQDLSVEFGQSTSAMAQGLYDILSAAIAPEDAIALLEQSAKTAAAGFTDVATTADLFTSILNAYGLEVKDAARISDVLFQSVFRGKMEFEDMAHELGPIMGIAAQAGVSIEDLGAAFATLTRQGIPTAEAATAIRGAIMSYIGPSKQAAELAKELGIEFNANALASDGLINSIGKLNNLTQEQLDILFPNVRSLVAVQGILSDLTGAYEDLSLNTNAANTTNEAFFKSTDTLNHPIDQLKTSVQVLIQEFGESMAPAIEGIIETIQKFIDILRSLDEEQMERLGNLFINLTKIVGLFAGLNLVGKAISGVGGAMKLVGEALSLSYGVLGPWGIAIAGIVAAFILLDKYSEPIIGFFEDLGKKLGIINDEMASFYDHTTDLTPQIQTVEKQITDTEAKIAELDDEFAKLASKGAEPPKELREEYARLNSELVALKMEYARLTGTQEAHNAATEAQQQNLSFTTDQLEEMLKPIDNVSDSMENAASTAENTSEKLEEMNETLEDLPDESAWDALTSGATEFEERMAALEQQYQNTIASIEAMGLPPTEKADAIAAVTETYLADIDNLVSSIGSGLNTVAEDANWDVISSNLSSYEKQLLEEEEKHQKLLAEINEKVFENEVDKNAAIEAEMRRHYKVLEELTKENMDNVVNNKALLNDLENYGKQGIDAYAAGFGDPKAIENAIQAGIVDPITQNLEAHSPPKALSEIDEWGYKAGEAWALSFENGVGSTLDKTISDLEKLVKAHQEKYNELLNMFEWTEKEKKEINKIANRDILAQLNDFTNQYTNEMAQAGASSEAITAGLELIILTLEKLGVESSVITQLKEQFNSLSPAIEETKDQIDDIINVISDIGDIAIGLSFGEEPTAGQIGGVVGGILGLFSGIPTWLGGVVDMVFGWIDDIQRRTRQAREEAEREIQDMIDGITGNTRQALVAFFNEPELDDAITAFGDKLNEVIYNMMVDAIVSAIISAEVMQDAAKKLGDAINKAIETGNMEGLTAAFDEYEKTLHDKILPILEELYSYTIPYYPYPQVIEGKVEEEIPSYQTGGYVPHTGLALLHAGEYVVPKEENYRSVQFGDVSIVVNTNGEVNGADLWDEFEREARRRGVALVQ